VNRDQTSRRILIIASIVGALGVTIGAFGAHGLDALLAKPGLHGAEGLSPELIAKRLDQFDVGVRYHLVHAVALLALAGFSFGSSRRRQVTSWLFTAGIVLFSGSLYILVLTNTPWLGAVTPLGGLAWIAAWLSLLAIAFLEQRDPA
jgi:uncharacterized membrane protein YgdD (TMEM256/DUF423 family)